MIIHCVQKSLNFIHNLNDQNKRKLANKQITWREKKRATCYLMKD